MLFKSKPKTIYRVYVKVALGGSISVGDFSSEEEADEAGTAYLRGDLSVTCAKIGDRPWRKLAVVDSFKIERKDL